MCWKASKYSLCSYKTKIPDCGMFQYNRDLCIKFILFNLVMWVPKFHFYREALYYVHSSQVLLYIEQEIVCLFGWFFSPPRNQMKISFSYDSSSNWLEYMLYSVFDIFWRVDYLWTAQQHCLFCNCLCALWRKYLLCVFRGQNENMLRWCRYKVFPCKRLDFVSLAKSPIKIMLNFSTCKVLV